MTSVNLEQKVRQLDNDVQALYDLIHKISTTQVRHTNRFNEIAQDVTGNSERLDGVEHRLTSLEGKVDSLEGKLDKVLDLLQR